MTADPGRLRRRAERRRHVAEYFAALVLLMKGYRIVAMRCRTKVGKGDLAVFVEVKARVAEREAIDAVGVAPRAMSGFHGAATPPPVTALVVAVIPGCLPRHFPDAF